ncbi:MAG: putative glycoside hydrolase [Lachnospiraceae bacterium]|nr:putative glycoside hydrolase [Lachnospiraceae bacterium]
MTKYRKALFPLMIVMLIIITGCGNQEMSVMSEDNVSVSENNTSVSENALVKDVPTDDELLQETDEEENLPEIEPEPLPEYKKVKVKGIYVTGPIAGTEKMDELITLVESTELNAMVIDVKNDEGVITYKMQSDTVLEIESGVRYISDMEKLIEKLHEKDIYVIARIVAFKDPYLAEKKPELCLKTDTGAVFRDKNGEAWVNPYKQEVWDYLVEIGAQAAKDGFDEIQFDYIRFSTDANADSIDYGEEAELMTKEEAITGFARYAYDKLHPLGVMVSADVFGTIIDNEADAEIVGQNYQEMAACLDYICPMVYPSHYSNGVYGLDIPDKEPYDTVYQAMNESRKKLETLTVDGELDEVERTVGVRVWIQDFTATWLKGHISYGPPEVRAQIQAIYDAGYEEWILWNARMNYTEGALLPNWQEAETAH